MIIWRPSIFVGKDSTTASSTQIVTHAVKHFHTDLLVGHLTTAETQRDLGLIAIFEKANQAAEFYLIVAFIGTRTEFNFLNLDNFLLLLLFLRRLTLFIKELAVVHDTTNWRLGVRADFN